MRIAVLGATGQTGQYLVKQAIQKGYGVTAVVRNPKKVEFQHEKLKVRLPKGRLVCNSCADNTVLLN